MSRRHDISWSTSQMQSAGDSTDGAIGVPAMNKHNDLLSFLAIVNHYGFNFIGATWEQNLPVLGLGGTAEVRELFVTNKSMYAYKRHKATNASKTYNFVDERRISDGGESLELIEKLFNEMVSEVTILGHPVIRHHQNFVGLAGIHWELSDDSDPWPVLVFDKAHQGDMWSFARSPKGLQMSFKDRLGVCLDIAQAITTLHELDMIHGDIKPQNCLIFVEDEFRSIAWQRPETIYAKLADFGYAAWNMDPSKEVFLCLPESKPWVGPEYHHRAFSIQQAKQLEIFSFGLTCLWFLFHDKLKALNSAIPDYLGLMSLENSFYDAKSIERFKRDALLSELASQLIDSKTALSGAAKQDLKFFFASSLDMNPQTRRLSIKSLVTTAGYEAPWISQVPDVEQHSLDYSNLSFMVADYFDILMLGPYRLREYLSSYILHEALNGRTVASAQKAAFQYSVCCKVGMGRSSSDEESRKWLEVSKRPYKDFQRQIDVIKRRAIGGGQTGYPGLNLGPESELASSLERDSSVYQVLRREIEDISKTVDPHCELLDKMIEKLVRSMLKTGHLDEAEKLLLDHTVLIAASSASTVNGEPKPSIEDRSAAAKQEAQAQKNIVISQPDNSGLSTEFDRILGLAKTLREEKMWVAHVLARVYMAREMWKEAEVILVQTRNVLLMILDKKVSLMANVLTSLSEVYEQLERWVEVEPIHDYLADSYNKTLGPNHPWALSLKLDLEGVKVIRGLQADESLLDELQTYSLQIDGQMNANVQKTKSIIGMQYLTQRRYKEAENMYREVLLMPAVPGFSEHNRRTVMSCLGSALDGQKRYDEAEPFHLASLSCEGPFQKDLLVDRAYNHKRWAEHLRVMGSLTKPAVILEDVIKQQNVKLSLADLITLDLKIELASIYHEQGRFAEEEQLFLPVIDRLQELQGPQNTQLAPWKAALAIVYARQQCYDDAESLLLEISEMTRQYSTKHKNPELLILKVNLAHIYERHFCYERAVNTLRGTISQFKACFGPTSLWTCAAMNSLLVGFAFTKQWKEAETISSAYLEAITSTHHDGLSRPVLHAVAKRAESLLATGQWSSALLFISRHVRSLIRWYWINLYWHEIRAVLRFLFNSRNFPGNAYLMAFVVMGFSGLFLALYSAFILSVWLVRSILLFEMSRMSEF